MIHSKNYQQQRNKISAVLMSASFTIKDTQQLASKIAEELAELDTVDIIASGYEWGCLVCNTSNTEMEIYNQVTCSDCKSVFTVGGVRHAHS